MVWLKRTASRVPRGRTGGGAGAGVGAVAAVEVDGAGPDGLVEFDGLAAATGGVCGVGAALLLLHPAKPVDRAEARIANMAIARQRLGDIFIGGASEAKVPRMADHGCGTLVVAAYAWSAGGIMRLWLFLSIVTIAVAPLEAPLLAGSHPVAAWLIRSFFSRLCHQNPVRSFTLAGSPVAVCVRCLGIYLGVAMGTLLRVPRTTAIRCLAATLLLNLLDAGSGILAWHGNLPLTRFLLGLLLGAAAGAVLFLPDAGWPLPEGLFRKLLTHPPGRLPGPR
ncbi:MAG TPA: DUF2085 domain-containing protein [Acidobacteriaceae bacterium]|nr:DUF2085 domain-containing protein [Acidobacteriaceae bacterium]